MLRYKLRHRVVAVAAPGVAGQEAFQGEPAAFPGAIFFDGFGSVGATGGGVAAFGSQ